jgi:hypothetical protein
LIRIEHIKRFSFFSIILLLFFILLFVFSFSFFSSFFSLEEEELN